MGEDYATPRATMALAEMLDEAAATLKTGGNVRKAARHLRRIADVLEQKI